MKLKTCLIATTALCASSAAFAADMPQVAEPVEYVGACDAYGSGYFQIPGKETCLAIGGRIRSQIRSGDLTEDGDASEWDSYTRGYMWFETQTAASFGQIYTYAGYSYKYDQNGSDTGFEADDAFIQVNTGNANLTFGALQSYYDNFTGYAWMAIGGSAWSDAGSLQATAEVELGDVTFGISAEDSTYRNDHSTNFNYIAAAKYSTPLFDVRLSGVIADKTELEFDIGGDGTSDKVSIVEDDYGYAVALRTEFRPADNLSISLQAQYGNGAGSFTGFSASNYGIEDAVNGVFPGQGETVAGMADAFLNGQGVTTMSVSGGLSYDISDEFSFMLEGGYKQWDAEFDGGVVHAALNGQNIETSGDGFMISSSLVYRPAPGLGIAFAAGYSKYNVEASMGALSAEAETDSARVGTRIQYTF